ncbi:hypothetical protein E6H16_02390, partial [Candidatus Bathyarchaeota archaeon]
MSEPQLQSLTRPSTRFELGVLFRRMAGVAKIRREAFIDLKQDNSRITNLEAIAVVAIAGLSLGLGEALVFPLSALLMIAQLVTSIALALLVTA